MTPTPAEIDALVKAAFLSGAASMRERAVLTAEKTSTALLPDGSFVSERVAKAILALPLEQDEPLTPESKPSID